MSDFFQLAIQGPFANGPLVLPQLYVDEARFLDHLADMWCYHDILPKIPACFDRKVCHTIHNVGWRDGAVFGYDFRDGFALLDVTTRGYMAARRQGKLMGVLSEVFGMPCSLKAFLVKGGPVGNTGI